MNTRPGTRAALAALALALALAGCGKSPEQRMQAARGYVQKGEYTSAVLELKTLLQGSPGDRDARLLLGQAYFALDAHADAEKELGKALAQGAPAEQVLPMLAKSLLRIGEAKRVLELALPESGLSPQTKAALHAMRAEAQLTLGRKEDAEASLAIASQADPQHPEYLLIKARQAILNQDPAQARQLVDAALRRDARFLEGLYLKAELMRLDGQKDEAIALYRQIIANDPNAFRAHLAIAGIHLQAGDLDAVDKAVQAAEKAAPTVPLVKYSRAALELRRGRLKEANEAIQQVLKVIPDHLPSLLLEATTSYGLGNYELSNKDARRVLAALPGNLFAAKTLAASQLKLNDAPGALATLAPLLQAHGDDAQLLAIAGEAHLQAREYDKAMAYLDRAAGLDPKNPAIKRQQAATHLARGENEQAIANLESAARLSDKANQSDMALVLMHLKAKAYPKALQSLAELEKKLPNNPVTHYLRGAALLGQNDAVGARKELGQALAIDPRFIHAAVSLARLDLRDKNPQAAGERFEAILEKDPGNVQAMLALADLAVANKQESAYVGWVDKAVKADPKAIEPRARLVRYYLARKEHPKAVALAQEGVNKNLDSLEALNLLGATQLASGDGKAALSTFTRLAEKAPNSPDAQYRLAQAQLVLKQVPAARDSLGQVLRINPNYAPAHDALLGLELQDHKPEAALQMARKLQALQPKSPLGFDREADIQVAQKRYPPAIKAYQQAIDRGAGAKGMIKLHRAMALSGDVKGADQKMTAWIRLQPKDMTLRTYLAEYYMFNGRDREAIAQYEELQKQVPNNAATLNNLAVLYQRVKDARALASAEAAARLAPNHPGVQDTLGWILVEQGQLPRALDILRQAAGKAPKAAAIQYHYGVALSRSGNKAEARKALEAALSSGQKFADLEAARALLRSL